jgi:hypothetical protein
LERRASSDRKDPSTPEPDIAVILASDLERKRGALLAVAGRWKALPIDAPSMREFLPRGDLELLQSSRGVPKTLRYRFDRVAFGRAPALETSSDPGE